MGQQLFQQYFSCHSPVMGLFILNDVQTGQPLAVMDCRWITAMRTGAVSAMAMEIYTRAKAQGLGTVLPLMEGELPYA